MRRNLISLAAAAALATAVTALAAPAHADAIDDSFLSALSGAGVHYQDPAGTAALGQSVCPMLSKPGGSFASAASNVVGNNGMSPAMAEMFTSIAISMYCPSMMASIEHGQMPNLPAVPGMPGVPGI
jgi:hypothetical protein